MPPGAGKNDPRSFGFFHTDFFLRDITGHERSLLEKRKRTVANIYDVSRELRIMDFKDLVESGSEVYVVARSEEVRAKLSGRELQEVFRSSEGRFSVFELAKPL